MLRKTSKRRRVRASQLAENPKASKGTGFTACGKSQRKRQEVSGHDFRRAASAIESTRALQLAEKLKTVKGTGFSPYVTLAVSTWALAPEGRFRPIRLKPRLSAVPRARMPRLRRTITNPPQKNRIKHEKNKTAGKIIKYVCPVSHPSN